MYILALAPSKQGKPSYIFLIEVKISHSSIEQIKGLLGFHSLFYMDNIQNRGGLALLWHEKA